MMEVLHDLYLESWAREHWAALHRVGAHERQVNLLRTCRAALEWRQIVGYIGRSLFTLGTRLEMMAR
jgi:predicted amidohydrolase